MKKIMMIAAAALLLSGCSTVRMPDLDFMKLPEFKDAAERIKGDYLDVSDAPDTPTDVRQAAEWDASAKKLIALRESAGAPVDPVTAKTPAEVAAEFDRLRQQVNAYRADDPVGGIDK